jgi:hypothetical protein
VVAVTVFHITKATRDYRPHQDYAMIPSTTTTLKPAPASGAGAEEVKR